MQAHRPLGLSTLAAVLALSSAARADEAPPDPVPELFLKGVKASEQQQWDPCRAALLAAFAIRRHALIAGNLAECELKLGRDRDAAEHAWYFAHALRPDAPDERRKAAEGLLQEATRKVGTVTVVVDVEDAEVLVDGRSAGKAPLAAPLFVEPGRHTVEALRAGYLGARVTVDAVAGEARAVVLVVKRKEGLPPVVEKGPSTAVLATGGAVTGVALVMGIAFAVVSNGHRSDSRGLQDQIDATGKGCVHGANKTPCVKLDDARSNTDTFRKLAIAGYVGAVGAAAGTVAYLLWSRPKSLPAAGVRVLPQVGSGMVGLLVEGGF